jgi:hypothetical protein
MSFLTLKKSSTDFPPISLESLFFASDFLNTSLSSKVNKENLYAKNPLSSQKPSSVSKETQVAAGGTLAAFILMVIAGAAAAGVIGYRKLQRNKHEDIANCLAKINIFGGDRKKITEAITHLPEGKINNLSKYVDNIKKNYPTLSNISLEEATQRREEVEAFFNNPGVIGFGRAKPASQPPRGGNTIKRETCQEFPPSPVETRKTPLDPKELTKEFGRAIGSAKTIPKTFQNYQTASENGAGKIIYNALETIVNLTPVRSAQKKFFLRYNNQNNAHNFTAIVEDKYGENASINRFSLPEDPNCVSKEALQAMIEILKKIKIIRRSSQAIDGAVAGLTGLIK